MRRKPIGKSVVRVILIGAPRRCETDQCGPNGDCMACNAYSGERCLAPPIMIVSTKTNERG